MPEVLWHFYFRCDRNGLNYRCSMKKNQAFVVVLIVMGLAILAGILFGRYTLVSLASETVNAACTFRSTDIIASAQGDVYNPNDESDSIVPETYYLAVYSVEGSAITNPEFQPVPNEWKDEQKDTALQDETWALFTDLIPPQDREMVARFNVFTDGYSNTLAAVDQLKEDPSLWVLEIDIEDIKDKDALMFTLVHEYAHLLTLNASQVIPDQEIVNNPGDISLQQKKAAACPAYFTGTGCSYDDSYINAFYRRFWVDINEEWKKIDALQYATDDQTPYYDGLYNFYLSHLDQFVDDYAVTHPTEDIAEAFAYFVFSPRPAGNSIKEQKIAFFYAYPELVQLREDILNGACSK